MKKEKEKRQREEERERMSEKWWQRQYVVCDVLCVVSTAIAAPATLISRAGEITVDSLRARDRRCLYRSGRFVSTQCHVKNNFATLQPLTLFPV